MRTTRNGMSLLELLVVISVIGIVATIGSIGGSRIAQREQAHGAVATLQQAVWQGATAAASRGTTVELVRNEGDLVLVKTADDEVLRTFPMPSGASIPVEDPILRFLPPGKVDDATLDRLDDLVLDTGEGRYRIAVSLIGEIDAEPVEETP